VPWCICIVIMKGNRTRVCCYVTRTFVKSIHEPVMKFHLGVSNKPFGNAKSFRVLYKSTEIITMRDFLSDLRQDEEPVRVNEKIPLMKQFNIPLEHLDFEYIEKCTSIQEIEKIFQILESVNLFLPIFTYN